MTVEQPLPRATDGPHMHDLVAEDLRELFAGVPGACAVAAALAGRKRLGVERYGQPLQAFNGRDALRDAYEEALDLLVYLRQVQVEGGRVLGVYRDAVRVACQLARLAETDGRDGPVAAGVSEGEPR